ncbi:ATP-binding protein [Thalassospira alkalitolerans]|uniref:ATP-binding protein n=1 Tax=Thalassospira alkalitolerans TaxID=1293890 RepID=UPI0030EB5192|tara:strand:- start:2876 stop:4270 length:1395 start_codon:yes stop_codon:yes gene_type:complete
MMKFATNSLQFALARRLTIIVTVFWIAGSGLAANSMYEEMEEAADTGLVETARQGSALIIDYLHTHAPDEAGGVVVIPAPSDGLVKGDDDVDAIIDIDFLMYQLRSETGDLLLRSHNSVTEPFPVPLQGGFYQDDDLRVYTAVIAEHNLYMQVAEPMEHRDEAILESISAQFLPIALLIPAVIIAIMFGVRQGLKPVRHVRDEIEARSEGNLSPIEQDKAPDEISTIVTAVNRLMAKLDAALRAERTFTAHSAHELRTPIAAALAQTQRLLLELPKNHQGLKRAHQTEESLKRLSRLSEKLLQLARAEAGVGTSPSGENQKLGTTLGMVMDDLERVSDGAGRIEFDAQTAGALRANIDHDAFAICLRNLIENALKHGRQDEPVLIEIIGSDTIRVSNGGDVVNPADMADLTARFKRSNTKAGGAGLGLSIVETIMRNTGGKLTLQSPRPGKVDGFMAELRLHQS